MCVRPVSVSKMHWLWDLEVLLVCVFIGHVWVCTCGCVHVGVYMWVCVCMFVRCAIIRYMCTYVSVLAHPVALPILDWLTFLNGGPNSQQKTTKLISQLKLTSAPS